MNFDWQRQPNGKPTISINRIPLKGKNLNRDEIDEILEPQTQWEPEKFKNIWVCVIVPVNIFSVVGYAPSPEGSGLDGLDVMPDQFIAN